MRIKTILLPTCLGLLALLGTVLLSWRESKAAEPTREHLVFMQGTPQELDVYRIKGRFDGPTAMILGGIHGDEPGAFLSADGYVDLNLRKGNLIVVPRANFASIIHEHRGANGDMNRKFNAELRDDPEGQVIKILKSLMAESDLLLTLHDGSGFYRPIWESDLANPRRYGQCVIADAAVYHNGKGLTLDLEKTALTVIARLNKEIDNPLYKFHFFNMNTASQDSPHQEHRHSATYYALTRLGIPAFCIETSKQLPSLDLKVYQHNLAVNAFLELFGIERETPGVFSQKPALGFILVAINDGMPIAVCDGQTLTVAPGDQLEVVHVDANYARGVSVDISGVEGFNHLNKALRLRQPASIVIRKDSKVLGRIKVNLHEPGSGASAPVLSGESRIKPFQSARVADLDMLPGTKIIAQLERPIPTAHPGHGEMAASANAEHFENRHLFTTDNKNRHLVLPPRRAAQADLRPIRDRNNVMTGYIDMNLLSLTRKPRQPYLTAFVDLGPLRPGGKATIGQPTTADAGGQRKSKAPASTVASGEKPAGATLKKSGLGINGFKVEVDGQALEIKPGAELPILAGSIIKMVDISAETPLPDGVVMNLKGFVAPGNELDNTGEDRGAVVNTAKDMMQEFSKGRKGEIYAINAELGKEILASCAIRIIQPKLLSVTVRYEGQTKVLPIGSRTPIRPGTRIELLSVNLSGGLELNKPRFTLAGRPLPAQLPQTMLMRDIAINLAVFNGDWLAGKVTWLPAAD